MSHIVINPYKNFSASATAIRDQLRSMRQTCNKKSMDIDTFYEQWTRNAPQFRHDKILVVNWGMSNCKVDPRITRQSAQNIWHVARSGNNGIPVSVIKCLNRDITTISNKLTFFNNYGTAGNLTDLPAYWRPTVSDAEAQMLRVFLSTGGKVVERQKLNASGGEGIRILRRLQDFDNHAPQHLYVQYIKKAEEYRVHFAGNNIIAIQQKRLRRDAEGQEMIEGANKFEVRNLQTGWVFCRQDVTLPPNARALVERFIPRLREKGIDFGAIDLIYNQRNNAGYVLEVNSAPGCEGQTVIDYANYFKQEADAL